MSELPPLPGSQSSARWTLWVSKDIRDRFDERKLILAPSKTHGGFVELMLLYRNKLAESGQLPVFEAKMIESSPKKISSSSSSSSGATSKRNSKRAASDAGNSTFPTPPLFNFASTMTLNDQMVIDASSYSYAMNGTPAFDSEASFYTNSSHIGSAPFAFHNLSNDVAKEGYPDLTSNPIYASAETVHNFDDVLNTLAAPLIDTNYFPMEQFMDQHQAVSFLNAASYAYPQKPQQMQEPQENYLPDLGPFYQPVSYNIGDKVHEFGYLPNL